MEPNNPITFDCPSCGIKLSVQREMVHMRGPCPHCHEIIQVPHQNLPDVSLGKPEIVYKDEPEIASPPSPSQLGLPLDDSVVGTEQSEKPELVAGPEIVIPTPKTVLSEPKIAQVRSINQLIYTFVIFVLGFVVGYLANIKFPFQRDQATSNELPLEKQNNAAPVIATEPVLELEEKSTSTEVLTSEDSRQLDTPSPAEQKPMDLAAASLLALEKFLAMKNFEERSGLIESDLTRAELVDSILDEPLPKVLSIEVDICERRSKEKIIDTYYRVDFDQEGGGENLQTILVRARGNAEPKVVVDPFLDLFGGKLATFATNQNAETGVFQAVILAGAYCREEIPNAHNMHCLKLLSREDASEIATAYFDKQSSIAAVLEDELSGLAYGQAKAYKVSLRWVAGVGSQKTYLEAIGLESMHWNP